MSEILEKINGPEDLRELSVDEMKLLADEIRDFTITSISNRGGHLASNLGAVELTLALHRVFDFKEDKLLWDVGHQCYTHKIITGRKDKFDKLRRSGGISGFPNPNESEYDQFAVGHAGTSISTAIGMALAAQQKGTDERVVAFVGDASIVNGTSFEALNNLGLVKRQLLIVLNDNSMAIDATQGALAKYFSKVRLSQTYEDLRHRTHSILEHLPVFGKGMDEVVEKIKKGIRMVLPTSRLFESLNIPYFGPVDGHDIEALTDLFQALKELDHPAVLHVYTKKGKGYAPAGDDPSKYHSTGPFKAEDDETATKPSVKPRKYTEVFGEHLATLAEKDERITAITSAMCDGTGLGTFREKFKDRFYDVGIAESAAVDIAAGMAKSGLKPVVCIYSTFLQRAFDQIFQEVALQNLPVIFCVDRAGFVGEDGPTHHGLMDIGYFRMMPNMVLTAPADESEMRLAMEFAIGIDKPVVIRYPKAGVEEAVAESSRIPFELGKNVTVKKNSGSSVTIVSYGAMLGEVLKAAEALAQEGVEVDVVNARFASPIDEQIVTDLANQKMLVTVEEHSQACGFGSALLESAARTGKAKTPIRVLGSPGKYICPNERAQQLMETGLKADKIACSVKEMLREWQGTRV